MTDHASPSVDKSPRPILSVVDGISMLVGIVVGIGIFKTPQIVAANVGSEATFLAVWLLGGAITLVGALVYAELGSAHPNTGGEYHFLDKAFGRTTSLMFAWARLTVIQTGAIAAVAFVFGDYAQRILSLGDWGSAIYASLAILIFTLINLFGTPKGRGVQLFFSALTILGVSTIALAGILHDGAPPQQPAASTAPSGAVGLAMVLILLTYGGWNETAYLSAELKNPRRNLPRVLLFGIAVITVLYVLINLAYLNVLGLEGLRQSDAVAADAMARVLGDGGSAFLALAICVAALSTLNGTIFTGARLYYSLGRDLPLIGPLGTWQTERNAPVNAIIAQSAIALALVLLGAATRTGFQTIVEYTAPVFWFFLLLVGLAALILRTPGARSGEVFRVPFYPAAPLIFSLTCAYLLYSSVVYTGTGALLGVGVLLLGLPVVLADRAGGVFRAITRP
ncbi:APC family permease [Flaviflagellibacter deserti]|uniref:APC family permease n=1 Tax=Flaviflagellibacter deserti TaxID=2267266 RepID=A0ABV9Z492_9HYPH